MGNKSSKPVSISEHAQKYSKHEETINIFHAYFRQIPLSHVIPTDIIDLIIKYFKLNELNPRLYFLSLHQELNSNNYILECSSNTILRLLGNDKAHRLNDEFAAKTALEYEKLPHLIAQKFKKQRKRYSMYATVGGEKDSGSTDCQLIVFEVETGLDDQTATFFVSELPSFPFPVCRSSLVYSPTYHTLFAINGLSGDNIKQCIYSLDFASMDKKWNWELVTNKLLLKHNRCFGCMVEDRFIAIFGTKDHDYYDIDTYWYTERPFRGELFALNCNESITISETQTTLNNNGACVYSSKHHKIIVAGTHEAHLYDINKDYWFKSQTWSKHFGDCDNMLKLRISSLDPNIMFAEAVSTGWQNSIVIKLFDLRTYKPMKEYYFDFNHQYGSNASFVAPILL